MGVFLFLGDSSRPKAVLGTSFWYKKGPYGHHGEPHPPTLRVHFRLAVPPDLKDVFGIREIKRTLKTGSLFLAKKLASLLSGRLKLLFKMLRMRPLKPEDIKDIVTHRIEDALLQGVLRTALWPGQAIPRNSFVPAV